MSAPTVEVVRDGKRVRIESTQVVVGDVFFLRAGDLVPADARLLEATELCTDEAALTGESQAVEKHTYAVQSGEESNMVWASTVVVSGHGKAENIGYIRNEENKDLIDVGMYQPGTNPKLDTAIEMMPQINAFLQQRTSDSVNMQNTIEKSQKRVYNIG